MPRALCTPSFLTLLHVTVCLLSGREAIQGANMLSCWENGKRWDGGIVMLEGVNWCYQPLVWFQDNYSNAWSSVWAKQMAEAVQVPHLLFFFFWVLISHPPKNTQKIHSWAKRMCLDVEELVGCTAQKLPYHVWALARTRSRGWVEDAELDGDVSGLLRSTGTKLLWWCFLLWDFLVNTQMLDILGRALL